MDFMAPQVEEVIRCMKCGNCRETCPVFLITQDESSVARGKIRLIKAVIDGQLELTDRFQERIYNCLNCNACVITCPCGIEVDELITAARSGMVAAGKPLPEAQARVKANVVDRMNPFGEAREDRGSWLPESLQTPRPSRNLYHAGCAVSYATSRTGKALLRLLQAIDMDFTCMGNQERCCGDPYFRMGEEMLGRELVEQNIADYKRLGVETIFTSCAGCLKAFKQHYGNTFKVLHVTQLLASLLKEGKLILSKSLPKKIVYFDGCDIGRHSKVYEEPREVLRAIPGVSVVDFPANREDARCCGGPLMPSHPDLAKRIAAERITEAKALGVDMIAVACPTCLVNLKEGSTLVKDGPEIQDVIALVHRVAGAK
jgi:Fe-S oxidoreductase